MLRGIGCRIEHEAKEAAEKAANEARQSLTTAEQAQKDIIYEGVDIVIGTARRINKLYLMNGINLNDMNTLIIDDAQDLPRIDFAKDIVRISDSFPKCQFIVFSTDYDEKLKSLKNSFMSNALLVQE